jgi:glyoxylase-like metal-dependent hydrolase (beta-lactamase superfamily II)
VKNRIEEIAAGFYMLTLPMPFRLKYVNVFAAQGPEGVTLIDTGPQMEGVLPALETCLAGIGRRVEDCRRILITHFHADHCGLAGLIAERSGAEVFLSQTDDLALRTFLDHALRTERRRRFGLGHGLEAEAFDRLEEEMRRFRTATVPFAAQGFLADGDRLTLGGRVVEVVATPGHSHGHLSFYLPGERLLIAGDHVLPHITPNLSPDLLDPAFRPLKSYLASLERVACLPVERVFPSHGRPFEDLRGRVAQIRDHHRERKGLTFAALAQGARTAAEVSQSLFGPALPPFDRHLALNETYVHLVELEAEGQILREQDRGLTRFRRCPGGSA